MLLITVYSENPKTRLDRQSLVKVTNQSTANGKLANDHGRIRGKFRRRAVRAL